jgi:hypothetical protein
MFECLGRDERDWGAPVPERAQRERARRPRHFGTFQKAGPELTERLPNLLERAIEVLLDEPDRKAQDAIAKARERRIAARVSALPLLVRGVVDFDDEFPERSAKVDDEEFRRRVAEHDLATKADAEPRALQGGPEERLKMRGIGSKKVSDALETSAIFFGAAAGVRRERSETSETRQENPFRPAREPGTRPSWRRSRESGATRQLTNLSAALARLVRLFRRARLEGGAEGAVEISRKVGQ